MNLTGLSQGLSLLCHQLVGDVVLVNSADVLDGRLSHFLGYQQLALPNHLLGSSPCAALPFEGQRCGSGRREANVSSRRFRGSIFGSLKYWSAIVLRILTPA